MFPFCIQGLMIQKADSVSENPRNGSTFGWLKCFQLAISRQHSWSQNQTNSPSGRNIVTHPFDPVKICCYLGLDPECLDTHFLALVIFGFPGICELPKRGGINIA